MLYQISTKYGIIFLDYFSIIMTKKGIIFMKKVCTFLIALLLILSSLTLGVDQSEAASFRTVKVVNESSLVVKALHHQVLKL